MPELVNGQPTGRWIMNNNSSYTFVRTANGGAIPERSCLDAALELLGLYGKDTTHIVTRDVFGR